MNRRVLLAGTALSLPIAGLLPGRSLAQGETAPPQLRLSLTVDASADPVSMRDLVDRTARILTNRARLSGATTVTTTVTDDLRIVLNLSGFPDVDLAVRTLTTRGLLELIDPVGEVLEPGTVIVTSFGGEPWTTADGTPVAASVETVYDTIISSEDVVEAYASLDQMEQPVVGFVISRRASIDFETRTSANIGKPLSIVVDNRVISSPVIMAPISNGGLIAGLTQDEVDSLVIQLSTAPLPARVEIDRVSIAEPPA